MAEQASIYSTLIEAEFKAERDRKSAIDTRSATVVTTSGSLITVLTAVSALAGKGASSPFPQRALPLLVVALFAFSIAAASGIWAGWNRRYEIASTDAMRKMLSDRWSDDEVLARKEVADAHIRMIEALRATNSRKEVFLRVGWGFQLLALLVLTIVVLLALFAK